MTLFITPELGATGKYKYKAPFDTLGNNQTEFTCISVRTLTECLSVGENPFKKYYQPFGLTEEQYRTDVSQGASIVGLQSTVGTSLYLPNSFLLSYPDVSGVRYVTMVIGADIGAIPETMNLEVLCTEVQDVIYTRLGVMPDVKPVITSQPALISHDDHEKLERVRASTVQENKSLSAQILDLKSQISQLTVQNQAMANYIKTHTPGGA